MDFDWKKLVKTIAPTIGTVISGGNPLVGYGIKAISEAILGKSDGGIGEIEMALENANPEMLLKLKNADNTFKADMKKLDVDIAKLDYDDADSARKRQMETKDITPDALAFLLLTSFVGALMTLFWCPIPEANTQLIYVMLGSLGTLTVGACAYFHGSSRGSARKDIMLNEKK